MTNPPTFIGYYCFFCMYLAKSTTLAIIHIYYDYPNKYRKSCILLYSRYYIFDVNRAKIQSGLSVWLMSLCDGIIIRRFPPRNSRDCLFSLIPDDAWRRLAIPELKFAESRLSGGQRNAGWWAVHFSSSWRD